MQGFVNWMLAQDWSQRTVYSYKSKVQQFLVWIAEAPESRGHTLASCQEYRNHQTEAGLRPRSIRLTFTALRAYYRYLSEMQQVSDLPNLSAMRLPRFDAPQRNTPTDDEMHRLFSAIDTLDSYTSSERWHQARARAVLALLAYCGLRRSELLALDTRDIRTDVSPWAVHVRKGKGRQQRIIPLNDTAQSIVRDWLTARQAWTDANPDRKDQRALFPVDARRRMSHRALETMWGRLVIRAGLEGRGITPHSIRHWFATRALAMPGTALPDVQSLLGHASLETTYRYVHARDEGRAAAVDGLADLMRGTPTAIDAPRSELVRRSIPSRHTQTLPRALQRRRQRIA